jgi:hypothetical protein
MPQYDEVNDAEPVPTVAPVSAPAPRQAPRGGGQLGTIAIVLIAAVAGVGAFLVSKWLIP